MRAGIQNDLILYDPPGFPFGFAQGGEYVEPRVSPGMTALSNCNTVSYGGGRSILTYFDQPVVHKSIRKSLYFLGVSLRDLA
jgi:hypothetical protein